MYGLLRTKIEMEIEMKQVIKVVMLILLIAFALLNVLRFGMTGHLFNLAVGIGDAVIAISIAMLL